MKKLLALGLSLAMMASLSAVAFAEEEIVGPSEDPMGGEVVVKTIKPETPGAADQFVVTIPANHEFQWNTADSYALDATVKGQMEENSSVKVSIEETNGDLALTSDTLQGSVIATLSFTEDTVLGSELKGLNEAVPCGTGAVSVTVESFKTAEQIGEYSTSINYLVEYSTNVEA